MHNKLEKEMRAMMCSCDCLTDILYNGESAIGRLNEDINVKISFDGGIMADERNGILVEIINKRLGRIDAMKFKFSDILGMTKMPSGREVRHYLWKNSGEFDWYGPAPTSVQKQKIMGAIYTYIRLYK